MKQRRQLLKFLLGAPILASSTNQAWSCAFPPSLMEKPIVLKSIPKSGEAISPIGMGTSRTFDVPLNSEKMKQLQQVIELFFQLGGQLIDSSPMYGNAEAVTGRLLSNSNNPAKLFAASKVWTYGREQGIEAINKTQQLMNQKVMDLMQVHNLRDWKIQLPLLHELKAQKKLRYVGITTSSAKQYDEFEQVIKQSELDFIQINYNIAFRKAARRILPLAQDKGIAVIVNRPYQKGRLFKAVKGKKLPEWSQDFDCESWGQFFLKYIVSHPAVSCAIPATTKPKHMKDNMMAMRGEMPSTTHRSRMETFFSKLNI
jgi:diketogulonate reductase-like aldo/keto reductase